MKINRFLVLTVPLFTFILLELVFFYPSLIYVSVILGSMLIFYAVHNFTSLSVKEKKRWNYLILPILFYISTISISLIIVNWLLVEFIFVIATIFVYLYLKQVYYLNIVEGDVVINSLENISSYGNFLVILFFATAIYGLQAFLNISIWFSTLVFVPIIALSSYEVFWSNNLLKNKYLIFNILLCIILTEIAWAATFLPINHYVVGFMIAICYYMFIGLTRFYLRKNLNKKIIKLYLLFGFLGLTIILLTARWM